ncbi:MAG: hypothetical protein KGN02_00805 [bacterium]|nr:hypothetical protein [bacterium]
MKVPGYAIPPLALAAALLLLVAILALVPAPPHAHVTADGVAWLLARS